jgi:UDP-glucose 4-epimerase
VVDLAKGHLRALDRLAANPGLAIYNLGTNRGYSVLEVIAAFEKAYGGAIPYQIYPRRPGDIATSYADASKANQELNWRGEKDLDDICADTWRWQSNNPNGYE